MNRKSLKKVFATVLALSLITAPVMGVNASTVNNAPSGGSDTSVSAEVVTTIPQTSTVVVGAKILVSKIKGAYMSERIRGTVVTTDKETLAAAYALTAEERPYVKIYDISEKKSPAAMASLNAAAEAVGGTVVAAVNVELGKLAGRKFSLLAEDGASVSMIFGIPKDAVKEGAGYAMICVRPGGVFEVLSDLDTDPSTVLFKTKGGLGAYAIVMYPVA